MPKQSATGAYKKRTGRSSSVYGVTSAELVKLVVRPNSALPAPLELHHACLPCDATPPPLQNRSVDVA